MRPNFWRPAISVKQEVVAIDSKTLCAARSNRKHERAPCGHRIARDASYRGRAASES